MRPLPPVCPSSRDKRLTDGILLEGARFNSTGVREELRQCLWANLPPEDGEGRLSKARTKKTIARVKPAPRRRRTVVRALQDGSIDRKGRSASDDDSALKGSGLKCLTPPGPMLPHQT
jgi:hypothetical protein